MEHNEERSPGMWEMPVVLPTEAALRLQVTDLLLGRPPDSRIGWSTLEKGDVLQQIEAALEAYGSYFYSAERGRRDGKRTARRKDEDLVPGASKISES